LILIIGLGLLVRHFISSVLYRSQSEAEAGLRELLHQELEGSEFAAPPKPEKQRRFFKRADTSASGSPTINALSGRLERTGWFEQGEGKTFIDRLDQELIVAGIRYKMTPYQALATAILIWGMGVILPTFMYFAVGIPVFLYVLVVIVFAVYPPMKLRSLKQDRQDSLKMELPVFIQQLRMLLSSNMTTLDDAIARVVHNAEIDPYDSSLAREFGQAQTEYRLGGVDREVALRRIGERTRVPSVQNLVEAIIQGLRTGTDMERVLEEYGKQARELWRQDMRSFTARKEPLITIGMVITMFGGFILIAAPLLINLVQTLKGF